MPRTRIRADGVTEDTIEDKDGDTRVSVEESTDEDKIRFDTGGTERMIIDSSGRVGINTSTPAYLLDIKTNNGGIRLGNTEASGEKSSNIHFTELADSSGLNRYGFSLNYNASDNAFNIVRHNDNTTGTPMMNFSRAYGNIQIGDVEPSLFAGATTPKVWANADVSGKGIIRCSQHSDDTDPPQFEITKGRGSISSPSAVLQNDYTGQLRAMGYDGSDYVMTADILWQATDDITTTSRPSDMIIRTTASGSVTTLERMRVTHDGRVGIGTSSPNAELDVEGDLVISGSQLKITSAGPTSLFLQADTDNVTETDTSFIKMTQDGAYLTSYLGYIGNDGEDPEGGSLTDALANTLLLSCNNTFPGALSRIQIATEQAVRMTIEDDGKIGVGTTSPTSLLTLNGTQPKLTFRESDSDRAEISINDSDNLVITNQSTNKYVVFKTNDQGNIREGLRIGGPVPEVVVNEGSDSLVDFRVESDNNTHMLFVDGGNDKVGIGTTSPNDELDVTGNVRVSNYIRLNCQNTVDPTGTPPLLNHAHIYSKLTSGVAEIFVQDSSSNVTQISPHNAEGEWQYFSRNTRTGKVVRVNMEKMIRKLEEITGESFMEEWYEDPAD